MKSLALATSLFLVVGLSRAAPQSYSVPGGGGGGSNVGQPTGGRPTFGGGAPSPPVTNTGGGGGGGGFVDPGPTRVPKYTFQWDVDDADSGNFYGHAEARDGNVTEGRYYVQLPDGRLMKVEYKVDEWGYNPTITFEGEAQTPDLPQPTGGRQPPTGGRQPPTGGGGGGNSTPVQPQPTAPNQLYGSPRG